MDIFDLPGGDDNPVATESAATNVTDDIFGGMTVVSEPAKVEETPVEPTTAQPAVEAEEEDEEDEEEITFLSIWQEKRAKHLQEKKEREQQSKQSLLDEAKNAVASFYKNREEQINANKEENRKQQAAFQETKYPENWKGVSQVIGDSLTKPKLGMAGHASETNRYRKLLIQLKNSDQKATI